MENRKEEMEKRAAGESSNVSSLRALIFLPHHLSNSRLLRVGFFQVVDGGFVEVAEVHAQAFAESNFA